MKPTTLFCLPYAGGSSAVFRGWQQSTPDWLSVETLHLPGRGIRHQEALQPNWDGLIERLLVDVAPFLDRRIALFGHSLGALLSFELAHALHERHGIEPCWLGVSACPPTYLSQDRNALAELPAANGARRIVGIRTNRFRIAG